MLSCRKTPTALHYRGSLSNHKAVEILAILCSTVFVIRARAVISQVSGSHVLGHSHFTGLAYPYCDLLTMPSLNYTISGTLILHSTIFRCSTRQSWKKPHVMSSLSGLFPLSDLWYSSHRRHIGRLHPLFCVLRVPLSRTHTTLGTL